MLKWPSIDIVGLLTLLTVIVTYCISQKELNRDGFKDDLFTLIEIHHKMIDNLYWEEKVVGRDAFRIYRDRICLEMSSMSVRDVEHSTYVTSYSGIRSLIETYAKSLGTILFFIESSDVLSIKDKQYYTSIVANQLSVHEKIAIFYHTVLGPQNNIHIQNIIRAEKKYCFLADVDRMWLCHPDDIIYFDQRGIHKIDNDGPYLFNDCQMDTSF